MKMLGRTQSLNNLYFESNKTHSLSSGLSKSLTSIHLHVSSSWFNFNQNLTRSTSLNHVNNVDREPKFQMNSKLITTKLIDDQNLPNTISDDLFDVLMRYEKNRLRTFKNWPIDHVTPEDLSKAGFYYLLESDLVRCFECKLVLFNWEEDDQPVYEHFKNNVKCRLMNGNDVGNVPIDRSRTPNDLLRELIDFSEFRHVPPDNNQEFIFNPDDLDKFDEDVDMEALDESALRFCRQSIEPVSPLFKHALQDQISFNEEQLFDLMKSEKQRLKTFDTWPEHLVNKVRPVDLAQCGFFYTTIRDRVICAFCRTPAWDWATTDVPIKEHYRHYSDCPLLNDEECGNQPIKPVKFRELLLDYQDIPPSPSSSYSDDDVLRFTIPISSNDDDSTSFHPTSQNQEPFDDENLNVPIDLNKLNLITPHKHVEKLYAYENRLRTFNQWPRKDVSKSKLAEAGFYYQGFEEEVKCVSCNLALAGWSSTDDPWVEHCKYKSNCEFLNLNKGVRFITRYSKSKNSPKIQMKCSGSTGASSDSSSDIENEVSTNSEKDPKIGVCKICMENKADVVYLTCLHLATCGSCTIAMKDCPICKTPITSTMKVYIS